MANFKEELAKAEALIFDIDGVFTDGSLALLPGGDYLRTYNSKDGYAVTYAVSQGLRIFIISGGRGELLRRRFEMLRVERVYSNITDKAAVLREIEAEEGIDLRNTIYMGDDIPDFEVMKMVGLPVCPSDACPEIITVSVYVSQYPGGRGCVRDIIEQVLRAKGKWALHSQGVNTI